MKKKKKKREKEVEYSSHSTLLKMINDRTRLSIETHEQQQKSQIIQFISRSNLRCMTQSKEGSETTTFRFVSSFGNAIS